MKKPFQYLARAGIVVLAFSCREVGDDDHPGTQSSDDAKPVPMIDGRQEKLVPGSRNPGVGEQEE